MKKIKVIVDRSDGTSETLGSSEGYFLDPSYFEYRYHYYESMRLLLSDLILNKIQTDRSAFSFDVGDTIRLEQAE